MKRTILTLLTCLMASISTTRAGDDTPRSPLDALKNFVGGEYRISAAWKGDTAAMEARTTWKWGVGHKFIICRTFITTPNGKEYQRYEDVFGVENGQLIDWSFRYDGTMHPQPMQIDGDAFRSNWTTEDGTRIRQTIQAPDGGSFRWVVQVQKPGATEWEQVMDGTWKRVGEAKDDDTADKPIGYPTTQPSDDSRLLDHVAQLIGKWHIDAKWDNGNDLHGNQEIAWGVGKKFVTCRTFLLKPDGSVDYQRYYTVFGAQGGKLMAYHFIFDGTTDFEPMSVTGERISSARTSTHADGNSVFNQFIELTDPNTLHWKVWTTQAGEDKPMMDGIWKRVS